MTHIEKQYLCELAEDYAEKVREERLRPLEDRVGPTPGLEYRRGLLSGYCAAFHLDISGEYTHELVVKNGHGAVLARAALREPDGRKGE